MDWPIAQSIEMELDGLTMYGILRIDDIIYRKIPGSHPKEVVARYFLNGAVKQGRDFDVVTREERNVLVKAQNPHVDIYLRRIARQKIEVGDLLVVTPLDFDIGAVRFEVKPALAKDDEFEYVMPGRVRNIVNLLDII